MAQLNNIKTVSVAGIGKLPLANNPGTFTPSGVKRDHKPGRLAEDGGYVENSVPAKCECNLNLQAGFDFSSLGAIKDVNVIVRLADGSSHSMVQAFAAEPPALGEGDGKLTLMANTSEKL